VRGGGLGSIIHASGSWVAFGFLYIYNFMRFISVFMRRFRYIAKPGVLLDSESRVCSYIFEIQAPGLRQTFCLALGAR
jgi:hypothetical protein